MSQTLHIRSSFAKHLIEFKHTANNNLFTDRATTIEFVNTNNGHSVPQFINEYWTSKQRQANSIHEISYRACFKPQLPRFFIERFTKENDIVCDPFSGRGTTIIEAAICGRNIISNDVNPLSEILSKARLFIPSLNDIIKRLSEIKIDLQLDNEIDLSMFYHKKTLSEILSLRNYLNDKRETGSEDYIDSWIRMIATNRLTGHSKGFFSVYTLPPNQAVSSEKQVKINELRNQYPEYRNVKEIIIDKSKSLTRNITKTLTDKLKRIGENALFLSNDASNLHSVKSESVKLVITSPPFLDIVQYANDNWLRCWFNDINIEEVESKITQTKTIDEWCKKMTDVFNELYRILNEDGYVIFEVGEVRNGKIKLDEYIVDIGNSTGFKCEGIMINDQIFTKTSNIWGVSNNKKGTNSNRIVIFRK